MVLLFTSISRTVFPLMFFVMRAGLLWSKEWILARLLDCRIEARRPGTWDRCTNVRSYKKIGSSSCPKGESNKSGEMRFRKRRGYEWLRLTCDMAGAELRDVERDMVPMSTSSRSCPIETIWISKFRSSKNSRALDDLFSSPTPSRIA